MHAYDVVEEIREKTAVLLPRTVASQLKLLDVTATQLKCGRAPALQRFSKSTPANSKGVREKATSLASTVCQRDERGREEAWKGRELCTLRTSEVDCCIGR